MAVKTKKKSSCNHQWETMNDVNTGMAYHRCSKCYQYKDLNMEWGTIPVGNRQHYDILRTNKTSIIREEQLNGVNYAVVPCVLVQEQVMNSMLLQADEIEKSVNGWNGRPVVINHPTDQGGDYKSANDPIEAAQSQVGIIYNIEFDGEAAKLKAELWLDTKKMKAIGNDAADALTAIEKGKPLEVSTGYFSELMPAEGEWNGKQYSGIQYNIMPDHLALLPNDVGACSFADGCGIRANSKKNPLKGGKTLGKFIQLLNNMKDPLQKKVTMKANEMGVYEMFDAMRSALGDKFTMQNVSVNDIYPDTNTVIFDVWDGQSSTYKTYSASYSVDANDAISIGESCTEVKRKVNYVPVNAADTATEEDTGEGDESGTAAEAAEETATEEEADTNAATEEEDTTEESTTEEADAEATATEEDAAATEEDDTKKKKVAAQATKKPGCNTAAKKPVSNCNSDVPANVAKYIAGIPDANVKKFLTDNVNAMTANRAKMIKAIVANKALGFGEADLAPLPTCSIERIYKFATQKQAPAANANTATERVPEQETTLFGNNQNEEIIPLAVDLFKPTK